MTSYFAQANPKALPYGFVPEIASLKTAAVSSGTGATAAALAPPAKAVVPPAPKDPTDTSLPGIAGLAEAGVGSQVGAASRGKSAPGGAAIDGGTGEPVPGVAGAENAVQPMKQLPVTGVESEEDLQSFLTAAGRGRLVLVDFGAEWCKNCKAILVSEGVRECAPAAVTSCKTGLSAGGV